MPAPFQYNRIKYIIFDLDGTLYKNVEISQRFADAAYHTMAKFKNISLKDAQRLIEERRKDLKDKKGFSVPYTLTLLSYDVPIEFWHKENIKFFDPRDYLGEDSKLKANLLKLKQKFRLAVLTNNNDIQTNRVLEAIGIQRLFDGIFTYNSFKILKPDIELFKKVLKKIKAAPQECLVVGDRDDIDLSPARKLGMKTLEVSGPEDLYNLGNHNS